MKAIVLLLMFVSFLVTPVFAAKLLPGGAPCMFNSDCISGKCRGGANKRCQGPKLLGAGDPCSANAQCSSGKCRGGSNKRCQGD